MGIGENWDPRRVRTSGRCHTGSGLVADEEAAYALAVTVNGTAPGRRARSTTTSGCASKHRGDRHPTRAGHVSADEARVQVAGEHPVRADIWSGRTAAPVPIHVSRGCPEVAAVIFRHLFERRHKLAALVAIRKTEPARDPAPGRSRIVDHHEAPVVTAHFHADVLPDLTAAPCATDSSMCWFTGDAQPGWPQPFIEKVVAK